TISATMLARDNFSRALKSSSLRSRNFSRELRRTRRSLGEGGHPQRLPDADASSRPGSRREDAWPRALLVANQAIAPATKYSDASAKNARSIPSPGSRKNVA